MNEQRQKEIEKLPRITLEWTDMDLTDKLVEITDKINEIIDFLTPSLVEEK